MDRQDFDDCTGAEQPGPCEQTWISFAPTKARALRLTSPEVTAATQVRLFGSTKVAGKKPGLP